MVLNLEEVIERAREYVELEANTQVTEVEFIESFRIFGEEDVALSVTTTDPEIPGWWVIGGSSPMNLYSKLDYPSVDIAFSLHLGLLTRIADRDFKTSRVRPDGLGYDTFISHATEDKEDFVRPLAEELSDLGLRIWYDEFTLTVGDSLRQSIDKGLVTSRFGIVVFSNFFFAKNWPQYELNGLTAREIDGKKVILPIWHNITRQDLLAYGPSLADKLALNSANQDVSELATELFHVIMTES